MQTARQAVTVTLRALAQLRKAALEAARDRDRLGTQGRLVMRRAAVQVHFGVQRLYVMPLVIRLFHPQTGASYATRRSTQREHWDWYLTCCRCPLRSH